LQRGALFDLIIKMKLYFTILAHLFLVSVLLASNSTALAEKNPWSMYRHDEQGTAKSPFSGPEEPGPKWDFSAGYFAYFPPAIAGDDTIYLSANNRLFALRSEGTEK
jgi:hypothetical protein